jgi:hypothetical protein
MDRDIGGLRLAATVKGVCFKKRVITLDTIYKYMIIE